MRANRCGGHHSRNMNFNSGKSRRSKKSGRYSNSGKQSLRGQRKAAHFSNKIRKQNTRQNNATAKYAAKMSKNVSSANTQNETFTPEMLAMLIMTLTMASVKK